MIRKLIAVVAVSGSLILGVGVVAGAAAPGTSTPATPATHATRCVKAEARATRIKVRENKATTWLPKAEAREAKAKAAGHTKVAAAVGQHIARVQKLEARGNTVLAKIAVRCGSTTSAS